MGQTNRLALSFETSFPMFCRELAQGTKLMHLYSLQPCALTNERQGNFKQSSLSFFSQGKCTQKIGAFHLIKPVGTCTTTYFSCLYPLPCIPLREIKQLRPEYKCTLPPILFFTPLISVSERDVFTLSRKSDVLKWVCLYTVTLGSFARLKLQNLS